jgi:uncharacterized protein YqgC (DUF456 family)
MTVFLIIISSILMLAGLIGVVVPVLPGIQLAWLGLLIYAWGTGFEEISLAITIVFTVLTLLSLLLDYFIQVIGAKKFNASKYGLIGVFIGSTLGIFIFGFWGIILGPVIGAIAGELIAAGNIKQALKSAAGTMVGCIAGNLFKVVLILIMVGFFIASLF